MSYRIDPSRNLRDEVRRIAREQLERATGQLVAEEGDGNEAIHESRKRIKKVRGLYRLVRSAAPGFYARENARLRDTARSLSGVRDATALIETADELRRHLSPEIAPDSLSTVHDSLVARRDRMVGKRQDLRSCMAEAAQALNRALQALSGLSLEFGGRKGEAAVLAEGWRKICAQGLKAAEACMSRAEEADFHDLRKRVKYHWMHARLVDAAWPALMRLRRREARQIGDLVGDEHNLSLLSELILHEPEAVGSEADRDLLMRLVGDRRAALRAEATRRAGALFRDTPRREAKRLQVLWRKAS